MGEIELRDLEDKSKLLFEAVKKANEDVKTHLQSYISTGRILKGYEIVGWYGEIVTQELLGGVIIADDTKDYDVENIAKNERYSVKTRMGINGNWQVTSLIPNNTIDDESPTHLVFVHLNDAYGVESVWCYPWEELVNSGRLKPKKVKGVERGYTLTVKVSIDKPYLIYGTGK